MPLIHQFPKNAGCPYCYDGHLVYDDYSRRIYCSHCKYIVMIENFDNGDDINALKFYALR